ncbi:MAG: hypothetical protein GOVbin1753_61 [Prokaryotic dsDNA virus sp.]|nr:MAG: hypothetical protein GOVbin1753_61 [Prokaryotic dsDNA virus sp.]|tara:strand:+ start:35714 stop:36076 length:363 start_codon:yes stop_codon:yes gene_type:complete
MIVTQGKKRVAQLITGLQSNGTTKFVHIRVGNGGDSTSPSQTTLDNQVGAAKTATPDLVGNTLVYTVTYTGADISSNTISEIGIFDAATGGNMLSRIVFDDVGPLTASESITFTLRIEVE